MGMIKTIGRNALLVSLLWLAACGSSETTDSTGTPLPLGPNAPFREHADHSVSLPLCYLPGGTMGIPDPIAWDFLPEDLALLPVGKRPHDLPENVHLRTDTESYNRRYLFALRDGRVWYKSNPAFSDEQPDWRAAPMPACLVDTLIGIAADDDELIAIRRNGDIYGMDNILKAPLLFNWTSRWGPPVWTGLLGYHIPQDYRAWSWTVISQSEDGNWTDPADNLHPVGAGKVSHIWVLSADGQRYTYIDPWLPRDLAYEMCGPLRGRFKAVNISSSGSTILSINRYGDLYTRHFDFDLQGCNEVFFNYSFDDQRGIANPKIQLPSFDWVRQPKVPGEITHNISLHKLGANMVHRIMRIEGRDAQGQTGYWEKDIVDLDAAAWQFVHTDAPLRGTLLDNRPYDSSLLDIGDHEDLRYSRNLEQRHTLPTTLAGDDDWAAELLDFNVYCSPATLRIHTGGGETMDLILHSTDQIRQLPRGRGLDDDPRKFRGAIEVPAAMLARLDSLSVRQQAFIERYLGQRPFTEVSFSGITGEITISEKAALLKGFSWVFKRP
jgi:hypothetical protein